MKRSYEDLLEKHFLQDRQMAFLSGPRQVGKTTSSIALREDLAYFNWDNENHRSLITSGPNEIMDSLGTADPSLLVFDEIHKFPHWKDFLKGLFDTHTQDRIPILVTGSARLDIYRKGADSLMGRYFHYRMHPLSIAEILSPSLNDTEVSDPSEISQEDFDALLRFGGFPEPFLKRSPAFFRKWKQTRIKLLFREDLRDLHQIRELGQVELLAEFLKQQAGQVLNHASLARKIRASEESIRRWIQSLESLYWCFRVPPWSNNIPRSLIKGSKVYMWDWSVLADTGARHENLVASHLLKAVQGWQDRGLGEYGLFFLRTRDGREVDFLVSRDGKPWFIVEVKTSPGTLKALRYFQERTGAPHAFQLVINEKYQPVNAFENPRPVKISAMSFLSQLV